jgi:diguanylate cyclase (GGDEF)-like protein/PAS domain S-box-containing protein
MIDEAQRLQTLRSLRILDTPPDQRFDRIARVAAHVFGCPEGMIGFLDETRLWFKTSVRLPAAEMPRERSLCDIVIQSDAPLVLTDASNDPRFADHPATQAPLRVRFYVGQAVHAPDGSRVGVLCVFDTEPHAVEPAQLEILNDLVAQVDAELDRRELLLARRRLQESERRYRALVDPNPDSVYTIDAAGRFLSVNEATLRLTGYRREELIDQPFLPLVAPEDQPRVLSAFEACLAGRPQYLRSRLVRKDGSEFHVAISAGPYVVEGELLGVAGISRDITEQVLAERQLRANQERLSLAWEVSGQAFWEWDLQSNRVELSGPLNPMLGYGERELAGDLQTSLALIHEDDRPQVLLATQRLQAGERQRFECEFRIRCRDGRYRWVLNHGKAVHRAGEPAKIIGALADIHARKLIEDERLRQAERMALAVRAGGVGIFELDMESGRFSWDDRMYELYGTPPGAAGPSVESVALLCHPEDRQEFLLSYQRIRRGEQHSIDTERRLLQTDGSIRYVRVLGKVLIPFEGGARVLIGTSWDVTPARQLQSQLSYQASHDALTGLVNRAEFERRLQEAHQLACRHGRMHATCYVDIDRFKVVNDTAGHAAGDALLREFAQLLSNQVRAGDLLARLGGDEFGLLLPGCTVEQAERVAGKLMHAIAAFRFKWGERAYDVSASIGIADLTAAASPYQVMSEADVACHTAKAAGRARISVYRADHSEARQYHHQLQLIADIREALEANRFCLYAQEIVATSGSAEGGHYELLVRMLGPDGKLIPPGAFIPAAERYDLMAHIDRWVFEEALQRQAARIAALPNVSISLNLSANSLNDPAFIAFAQELIARSPLPPQRIHLEITETAMVNQLSAASELIAKIRQLGCKVMLDDFGVGVSSFSYLKHFPVDYVKIDGSFVRGLKDSPVDRTIVESIHEVAHKLGARTVAEFVEDAETLRLLAAMGVDFAQGYGIAMPQPLAAVLAALEQAAP